MFEDRLPLQSPVTSALMRSVTSPDPANADWAPCVQLDSKGSFLTPSVVRVECTATESTVAERCCSDASSAPSVTLSSATTSSDVQDSGNTSSLLTTSPALVLRVLTLTFAADSDGFVIELGLLVTRFFVFSLALSPLSLSLTSLSLSFLPFSERRRRVPNDSFLPLSPLLGFDAPVVGLTSSSAVSLRTLPELAPSLRLSVSHDERRDARAPGSLPVLLAAAC